MGAFTALVVKDLREILTSRYFLASLLGGFVILIALGAVMGASIETAQKATQSFAVVVGNTTELGQRYAELLRELGGVLYEKFSPDLLDSYGYAVVVPPNFTLPAKVEVYAKYRGLLSTAAPPFVELAAQRLAEEVGVPPRPINAELYVYLDGRVFKPGEVAMLANLFLISWMFMFLVPLLVASTAAVAVGLEKEKRTFELILSTPATARTLVAAKLTSAVALAFIQFAVMAAALIFYFYNLSRAAPPVSSGEVAGDAVALPPALIAPVALSTLALSLALLGLAFIAATRVEDIKTAQSVVPMVVFPLLVPSFAAIFGTVEGLEAYPFVHPLAVAYSAMVGQWDKVYAFLATDWALAIAVVASILKFVTPDYLITGRWRR
ncbi:ABC-type Na+ efflux pump, permease component [Pyrobaculum oguniense TE7]|uniref:ABC-type Na+ efflux pump, permease component n=1 Tax=Pyrobaculum oguniense (strain DSM 13380 / JCM 10595 / TE7) TaxID=698757 RepID=H6QD07_PYROT|nr:ABC-type Na+ efflux pump, permease component [Pyrobaculum oguniense TE7]